MGEVLKFPEKPKEQDLGVVCGGVWTCGCESQAWRLYGNGVVLCLGCNCISTLLAVVQNRVTPEPQTSTQSEK